MTIQLQDIPPAEIEAESFRIIESEFSRHTGREISEFSLAEFKVIQRIIHATGDFSITGSMVFQDDPIRKAIDSIKAGGNIFTDVNMAASGISKPLLAKHGGRVICRVAEDATAELAAELGITRSEAAVRLSANDDIAVMAIGNAPTALISALNLIRNGEISPSVIIGVPVGFVNAAESKELLRESGLAAITLTGRRGGSPIAAAAVNAILHLAK